MDEITLVKIIKRKLALAYYTNKFDMDDEEIMDIIRTECLPEMSIYYPYHIEHIIEIDECRTDKPNQFWLKIPDNVRILSVEFLYNTEGIYSTYEGFEQAIRSSGNYMFDILNNNVYSFTNIPRTYYLMPPNKIFINPTPMAARVPINLHIEHLTTATMPAGLRPHIIAVCLGTVAENILAKRKYFNGINSTFGEIQLNTDVLENMVTQRKESLELMQANHLLDASKFVFVN